MINTMYELAQSKQSTVKIIYQVGNGIFLINRKSINIYFLNNLYILIKIKQILKILPQITLYNIFIKVQGGGLESQAKAIIVGLSKILQKLNPNFLTHIQIFGNLKPDLRIKERKKYGLRKARKAAQYSKR